MTLMRKELRFMARGDEILLLTAAAAEAATVVTAVVAATAAAADGSTRNSFNVPTSNNFLNGSSKRLYWIFKCYSGVYFS